MKTTMSQSQAPRIRQIPTAAATTRANRMAKADLHDAVAGQPRLDAVMQMQFAV